MAVTQHFSIGNIAAIDKVDSTLGGYFERVFGGIGGRSHDFIPLVKLLMANKLGSSLSVTRLSSHPDELFQMLGFQEAPAERNIHRTIVRVGLAFVFLLERHQQVLKEYGLVTHEQFIDFSSTYFEGKARGVGEFGYSRDDKSGKRQIVFGISTGINDIPTALTIQRGNVVDKTHFPFMLRTAQAILEPNSLLIFDCGANTKAIKAKIRKLGFHYLTLRQKKRGPYRVAIAQFTISPRTKVVPNEREYECAKVVTDQGVQYIFYSEKLKEEQLAEYPCREGTIVAKGSLQQNLDGEFNPEVTGLEGYFILESSVDEEPAKILQLYKERDRAEKLIRNIKEGTDLRPIRHWTRKAIMGYVLIVFLTNFVMSLTLLKAKDPAVKNGKLLKNYLLNLTVAVVYPEKGFRFRVLANVSEEIRSIFGVFIDRYRDKSLELRR